MSNFLDALDMIGKAEKLENYSVLMLTFYLIDVWELGIVYAAGLINIWLGITKLMPFAILFLFDNKYVGSYTMLIISTATSALGTGLLSLSTPSWFYSSITGSCDNYKMKCITEIQKWLFYLALVLIMIGRSSRKATMETLNFKNRAIKQERTHDLFPSAGYWLNNEASALVLAPWSILFGMPSVYTSMALYHLKGKSWSHKIYINEPERSPLTSVLRVVAASILNISQDNPYEDCDESEIDEPLLNRSFSLRFLEKAALQPPHDKGWPNRWTHCSIQEVENAKTIVRMLPVGFMFAFLVLIYTIGMTYFPQQWKRLNLLDYSTVLQIGNLDFIYLYFRTVDGLQEGVRNNLRYNSKYINKEKLPRDVIDGMILGILCYAVAAVVEKNRLGVIKQHGLMSKPDLEIPMTVLWLLPQLLILGRLDATLKGIFQMSLDEDLPIPLKNLKMFVVEGFNGVGIMSSVLVVYLVGKISEMDGKPNWFQHDTENSRLDLFYWTLTVLCVLVFTMWLSLHFSKKTNYRLIYVL